ncbi:MAG: 50S ribosomal protein L11 methyltransferase [Desulfovibrionaceae bacterium]
MDVLHKIEITVPEADAEALTGFLFVEYKYGWEEVALPAQDGGEARTLFRLHLENEPYGVELAQGVAARFPEARIDTSRTPNRNWALAWREFFTAVPAGDHFIVIAPWMRDEQPFADRIPIIIEPKTAFGTGHHPTTALCLEIVSELVSAGRLGAGMRFLDLGTGSGILGLGCAKLGMTGIGLDIDPLAIDNVMENKEINAVGDAFVAGAGSIDAVPSLAPADERFDLVLANILAEPLKDLAPEIVERVATGGCLILSGLLEIQAQAVAAAYTALGLPEPEMRISGEWGALFWR